MSLIADHLAQHPRHDRWARLALRFWRARRNEGLRWAHKLGRSGIPASDTDPTKVLVATGVGGHLTVLNFETMLAKALQLRGAKVSALLCDRVLPACMEAEHRFYPDNNSRAGLVRRGPKELCSSCTGVGLKQYEALGIDVWRYSSYLTADDYEQARDLARTLPVDALRGYKLDAIAVGEHAWAGVLRFLARGEIAGEPQGEGILRRYFEAALLTVAMMRSLIAREGIEVCVMNHGIYVPQGLISEVCRERGVRVVTWNPAYRKSCFILSHGDTYHHTLMNEPVDTWQNMQWDEVQEKKILGYLKSRWEGSQDWIWFHEKPQFDVAAISRQLGIDFSKPTIGLLTNVVWDAQLHYPANAFGSMTEWIIETIRFFATRPDLQLIIRVHPAEIRGTLPSRDRVVDVVNKNFPTLPTNVFLIPPESDVSSYVAMSQCKAVIIYGTKMGVELTSLGLPVIVAGEAWIRNKGVTRDVSSVADYRAVLDRLPEVDAMNAESIRRARQYAYHFFFRRMIPVDFMTKSEGLPALKPNVQDVGPLLPGNSAGLDLICRGILTGSEFVHRDEELSA